MALLLLASLAACGADGAPVPPPSSPSPSTPGPSTGVSVGGDARIGVVGGL
ncbi:argininosuccinate lyase [Palleronia sp. KMU-117]|uniref:argininosuccinate lyase n=1 Tax=Palleronia sp. KMU-117 TaxID=3434108 RepID=UPI003D73E10A